MSLLKWTDTTTELTLPPFPWVCWKRKTGRVSFLRSEPLTFFLLKCCFSTSVPLCPLNLVHFWFNSVKQQLLLSHFYKEEIRNNHSLHQPHFKIYSFSFQYYLSLCPRLCTRGRGQGNWTTVEHPMGCIWFCQEQFGAGAGCARSVSVWFRFPLLGNGHQGESLSTDCEWSWLANAQGLPSRYNWIHTHTNTHTRLHT